MASWIQTPPDSSAGPAPLPSRWLTLIPFGVLLIVALAVTIGLLVIAGGQA